MSDENVETKGRMPTGNGAPSADQVRRELSLILEHPEFRCTDKVRSFLRFVVEETLAGRHELIKGYTIATRVFGRGRDFDAAQDPVVRVQAGRLRQALERYYLVAGGQDPVRIDIPKGRYVPRFSQNGHGRAVAGRSGRDGRSGWVLPAPSIAVLPLEDLSGDSRQRFFSAGLTEEVITELTRFEGLAVVPCCHAPDGVRIPVDPVELGKVVGARFVLRGTIRRDSTSIKVSVHLSDGTDGQELWAESFSRSADVNSLIAVQEAIARRVVDAVASEYGIIARKLTVESLRKPPVDLSTYEALLRYYHYMAAPSRDAGAAVYAALRHAVENEPEHGPTWSAWAGLHCELYADDAPGVEQPLEAALEYSRRGVTLDPASQLGHLARAYALALAGEVSWFREEIEEALALNVNSAIATGSAAYLHMMVGDFDHGRALMDRALEAGPFHPGWFRQVYLLDDYRRGDYLAALHEFEKHRPAHDFWVPVLAAALFGKLDRPEEARSHLEQLQRAKPDFAGRARELISRSMKSEPLVEDLIDGLRRAGLPNEP